MTTAPMPKAISTTLAAIPAYWKSLFMAILCCADG
jgi:hypothetical protein